MQEIEFREFESFLNKVDYYKLILEIKLENRCLVCLNGQLNSYDFRKEMLKISIKKGTPCSTVYIDLTKIESIYIQNSWFCIKSKDNIEYRITTIEEVDL